MKDNITQEGKRSAVLMPLIITIAQVRQGRMNQPKAPAMRERLSQA